MTERAQKDVMAALADLHRKTMAPELRELNDAIEEVLHRAPSFDGDRELALRVAFAFSNVERLVDGLRSRP